MRRTLLALWMSALAASAARVSYVVTEGSSACQEERMPGWTKPKDYSVWGYDISRCQYDFRSSEGSQTFIGLSCMLENNSLKSSPEKYTFIPILPKSAKPVNEMMWESASTLQPVKASPQPTNPPTGYVEFRGNRFPKTGPKWLGYFISLDLTRIAVLSWDGIIEHGGWNIFGFASLNPSISPMAMFSWRTHIDGRYWIDIYDVASASRIIQIQGEFHGAEPVGLPTKPKVARRPRSEWFPSRIAARRVAYSPRWSL